MYRKLMSYVKHFIFVRQGSFNRYYEGKLISIDEDTLQIQSYKKDGNPEEVWTIMLNSITEFSTGGRHLAELELKAAFAASGSMDQEEDTEEETVETVLAAETCSAGDTPDEGTSTSTADGVEG